ncbi:MAG: fibronectin type III domain-containing protein, partial [Puniceicoccales bacterium]|nr:fibronectin type III domain-containing protein [Puniceicoccales bacterium]
MKKVAAYGRVNLHLMIVLVCMALAGGAFTMAPGNGGGLVGVGGSEEEGSNGVFAVWYGGERRAAFFFLTGNAEWASVDRLPVAPLDGSNQLKLYDVGSPLLPPGVSLQNVTGRGGWASNGAWLASVDEQGGVWLGSEFEEGADLVEMEGLPPVDTLALGAGHAVAFAQGEVWVWGLAHRISPGGVGPSGVPVRLEMGARVVAVGAWREFGFAKSDDGVIWLWQGSEGGGGIFEKEEEEAFAEEIGVLMGSVLPQEGEEDGTGVSLSADTTVPVSSVVSVQATSAPAPLVLPLEGLRLWLKADAGVVVDESGKVSQWQDQSGAGRHASQSVLARRPVQVAESTLDGNVAVHFDAAQSQQLGLPHFMSGATEGEAFVVLKATSATPSSYRGLWRMGAGTNCYPQSNGVLVEHFGSNTSRSMGAPAADITQWHVYNVSSKPGEWAVRINGVQQYHVTTNTVSWNTTPLIGHSGSYAFDGAIAEILVFEKVLTAAERVTVGHYLRSRHELSGVIAPTVAPVLSGQVVGAGQIYLTWEAPAESTWTEYVIERSEDGLEWTPVVNVGMGRRNYLGQNLTAGVCHYRLKTRNWAGESGWSNPVVLAVEQDSVAVVPVEGLRLWLRADAGVEADAGGGVECWTDVSGCGNHAVQAVAASRPALVAASSGEARPVVRFTRASQQKLELPAGLMAGANVGDAFVVLRANAFKPATPSGLWRAGAAVGYYPQTNGVLTDAFGSNAARELGAAQADITRRHLLEISAAPGQWISRLNGFGQARTDSNTVGWNGAPLLGHNGSYAFDGEIEEVLIYDRVLGDAEREQVRLQLNARHQFNVTVPTVPEGLQARPGNQGGVELLWAAPATAPATQIEYIIERSTDGTVFEEIARTPWRNHTDADAVSGSAYIYRIKARNWFGDSAYATAVPLAAGSTAAFPPVPARENLRLWLRADQGVFTDGTPGNAVERWQDQSGKGNHAVQFAAANRPALAADAISGKALVRFTAAQKQSLSFLNVMQGAAAAEVIIRVKTSAATYSVDNGLWKWSASGAAYPGRTAALADGTASNANQLQGAPILGLNQWRTYGISATAGQWTSRLDGLEQYSVAANTVAFISTPLLGTNGSTYFDGDIEEILIYDRTLDTAEREQLTRYLDARGGADVCPPTPEVPAGLTAVTESATAIVVRWTPPVDAGESLTYILERSVGEDGVFEEILWTSNGYASRSDYTDRGLSPGTTCVYRMKARNNIGIESVCSSPVAATTHEETAADSLWPVDIAPANLRLWLRADLGLVQGQGGALLAWEDQSGKNNHATQAQIASQPFAGGGAVVFDATKSQVLALPPALFTGAAAGDLFVVLKTTPTTPAADRGLWTFGTGASSYPQSTGLVAECAGTNTVRGMGLPLVDITGWHLYNVTVRPGEWIARFNGLEQYRDATANTVAFNTTAPKLGTGGSYFHGEIAELIVFDRVLTADERERLTRWLNSRHTALPVPAAAPAVPGGLEAASGRPSSAHVTWTLPDAPAIGVTYELERRTDGVELPGGFVSVFKFEHGNAMHCDFTDATVAAGQSYTYRFRARDAIGRESISGSTATVTIPATVSPGELTQTEGLRLWLRADRGVVTGTEGQLASWRDQSGQNNHATQAVPGSKPALAPSGAVLFGGSAANQHFVLPPSLMSGAASGEAFVILKSNTVASATRGLWRLGFSGSSNYPGTAGALAEDFGSNVQRALGVPRADITRRHLYHVTAAPGEWVARLNDIEQFRAGANTVSWNSAPRIGNNGSYGFDGEIDEILIYDRVLDDAARAAVRAYLDTRHALGIAAPPPAPVLSARAIPPLGAGLSWTFSAPETDSQFVLERSDDGGAFAPIATVGRHDRAYVDGAVQAGHVYAYRIKLVATTAGEGAWSNIATVTVTAEPAPATLANGLRLWLRAGEQVTVSGDGRVARWADQSGQGNHATQTGVAAMPRLSGDGTVAFAAAQNQQLVFPGTLMGNAAEGEIFILLKAAAATPASTRGLWRMGSSSYSYYPNASGVVVDDAGTSISRTVGLPDADITGWHLYNVSSKLGEWVARFNGRERIAFGANTVRWATSPLLGSNGSQGFDGGIAEVLIYDRVLTASERETLEGYLARKHIPGVATPPSAPASLTARVIGAGQVFLEWRNTSPSWTRLELQRKTGEGAYATIARPEGLTCVESGLESGQTFTYRLRANNAAGAGAWSNEAAVTLPGEATTPPPTIPLGSLRLWLKADTLAPGGVAFWRDQSGNGNHATASAASTQPQVVADSDGIPSVRFNAAQSQQLSLPHFMNGATAGEAFVVLKATSATPSAHRGLWRMGAAGNSYYPLNTGALSGFFGTTTSRSLGAPAADITQWHVYNVSSKPGEWSARFNGVQQHLATTNTVSWSTTPLLGHSGSYAFDGAIAEILVFEKVLSAAERETVQEYLAGRHRLAGSDETLAVPANLTTHALSSEQVSLQWNAEGNAWVRFEIEASVAGGEFVSKGIAAGRAYLVEGLEPGTEYTFRVRARSATAVSAWSNEITVQTPASGGVGIPLENVRLWLKSDTLPVGTLNGWPDQSGRNNSATSPNVAVRPEVVTDPETNRPVVRFNAAQSRQLNLPHFMNGATEGEAFVVLKATSATPSAHRGLWRMGAAGNSYYPLNTGALSDFFGTTTSRSLGAPAADITQWHVYNVSSKPGEWSARFNGVQQHLATTNTVSWSTTPLLGHSGSNAFDGSIAEILVFDRVLSAAERETISTYLQTRLIPIPETVLSAPENLTAVAIAWNQVALAWTAVPEPGATYELERRMEDGTFAKITDLDAGTISHTDTGLVAATTYTYRLRSKFGTQTSVYSNDATATTFAPPPQPPAAPTEFNATATGQTTIALTWVASPTADATCELERKTGENAFVKIADLPAGSTSYTDAGLTPATGYIYRLRAVKSGLFSAYTSEANATTDSPPPPIPDIPGNPSIGDITSNSITLVWTGPTDPALTYEIERSNDGVTFVKIAEVTGALAYTDSGLSSGTTYYYQIRARNSAGASDYTEELEASTVDTPPESEPPQSNLRLWLKADAGVETADGALVAWHDQTENGVVATPVSGAGHPSLVASALNALPVVRFNGVNSALSLGDFMNGAGEAEVFVVVKSAPLANSGLWTLGGSGGTVYPGVNGRVRDDTGSGGTHSFDAVCPTDAYHLYNVGSGPGFWYNEQNGAWVTAYPRNSFVFSPAAVLGRAVGSDAWFSGDLAEILVYDRALDAGEKEAAGAYLVKKYDLFPPPGLPESFEAIALSSHQVGLRWAPSQAGVIYMLEREYPIPDETAEEGYSMAWEAIGEVRGERGSAFVDTDVLPSSTYHYRLRARNLAGEAAGALYAEATTLAPGGIGGGDPEEGEWEEPVEWEDLPLLPAPEEFHVVPQAGQTDSSPDYTLAWEAVSALEEFDLYPVGYHIYANDVLLAELGAEAATFTFSPAQLPRGRHLLSVVAVDQYGRESVESDLISLEVDPLITVGAAQDNRQFSAKVEMKRIINQYFPVNMANDTVGHQAYQPTLITNVPWGMKWNCYPLKTENRLTGVDYLASRTLSDLTVGTPGVTSLAINSQGAYRFRVENHDRRARRVKFRWVEVFCPFPIGTVMGAGADNEYRENSQIIPDAAQNAIREVTLVLEDGDDEAVSEMYRVFSPEERGQVRVCLLDESLDVSASPSEVLAGADELKRPVDANKPAGGAMAYMYDKLKDYVIDCAENGAPEAVTGKPKGPLYEIKLGFGPTSEESVNGNMRLLLEQLMLTCPDGNDEKLEVY